MKVLLTLSLTCILFACSSIKKSKHVKVLQATETVIYPGVAGSPTTHHIVVKAEMKKTGKLQCDTFWSNGYADRARVFNSSMQDATGKEVKKGETVVFGFYYFV